jgi:hypothetical protein
MPSTKVPDGKGNGRKIASSQATNPAGIYAASSIRYSSCVGKFSIGVRAANVIVAKFVKDAHISQIPFLLKNGQCRVNTKCAGEGKDESRV